MGSDQIWNSNITGFDKTYFGYFPFPKGRKKYVAYAASMTAAELNEEQKDFFKKALDNFDAVSVRELHIAHLLQPLTNKDIKLVLDPTLLAVPTVWNTFLKPFPPLREKYVLVYQVWGVQGTLEIAHHIAQQLGAVVVVIAANPVWRCSKYLYQTESPQSFVNWIKYASCVVTTSFHGTAFSVILNRPFYCVRFGNSGDTRSTYLLELVGLLDRLVEHTASPDFEEIDYSVVNHILEVKRKDSMDFLYSVVR